MIHALAFSESVQVQVTRPFHVGHEIA
jgi:hypothetical protein